MGDCLDIGYGCCWTGRAFVDILLGATVPSVCRHFINEYVTIYTMMKLMSYSSIMSHLSHIE